ncbi:MAG: 16S rRNA (cytidine(1402)-2'-O)-methyltransferase [Parvularculaceae bacterium]
MTRDSKPQSFRVLAPGLYVAATPIGNLGDVTYRVIEALKGADKILCEDTRQTAKLLAAYGIDTPMSPYHDHNASLVRPGIIAALHGGARYMLVSDAGTPLISDPGAKLVREARAAGVAVIPLPGPSAFVAALSAAGVRTDRFLFAGFPPPKAEARRTFFRELVSVKASLVFYEGPSRLGESLAAMAEVFGPRRAVVARELTKIYEEFVEADLPALAARYALQDPKGEIVVIVDPPAEEAAPLPAEIDAFLVAALQTQPLKAAAAAAADAFSIPRKEAYARALVLKAGA